MKLQKCTNRKVDIGRWIGATVAIFLLLAPIFLMSAWAETVPQSTPQLLNNAVPNQLVRAMWVEAISDARPLDSELGVKQLLSDAASFGATDLYVQVYKAGKAWFRSSYAESPELPDGFDPLGTLLPLAHERGIKVHVWLNLFNLADNKDSRILKALGPDVLIKDNALVSSAQYIERPRALGIRKNLFTMDTPGYWVDPGSNKTKGYLLGMIQELVTSYPTIDGLHLDYFRYPYLIPVRVTSSMPYGFDFGYGDESVNTFRQESGYAEPFLRGKIGELEPAEGEIAVAWDRWRRARLTGYIGDIRKLLGPKHKLSLAAIAYTDRAYQSAFQDWPSWMGQGVLDSVAIMAYTKDPEQFRRLVRQAQSLKGEQNTLLAGIGAWLMPIDKIREQRQIALNNGADGVILFSYGNLKKRAQFDFGGIG